MIQTLADCRERDHQRACVRTTMREANDRGYECLVLSDCTGATELGSHTAAFADGEHAGRSLGCVTTSEAVLAATTKGDDHHAG